MLRRFFLSIALLSSFGNFLYAQNAAEPAGKKLDLRFVPDDAVVAIVAHPRRVLTSPQAALWPTEILTAASKKQVGFDALEIEQVIGVVGLPAPDGAPPPFGLIVRFREAVNADEMAAKIVQQGADDKVEGHRAKVAMARFEPSILFVDDRTVLVAFKQNLIWLLSAKPGNGPLQTLLRDADDSFTAVVYAAIAPMRPILSALLSSIRNDVPSAFRDALDLPMTVDTVQFAAHVGRNSQIGMTLELKLGTADEKTATNVASIIKRAMNDGRAMLMAAMSQQIQRDDNREVNDAIVKYTQRLGDVAVASLEPKPTGNQIVVKTELKAEVAEVGAMTSLLLPAVQAAREAGRRTQSANNLKQISLSLHNYHSANKKFPASATYDANGKPLLSWRVYMLPYLEELALFKQFHLDEPWDSDHNKNLIDKMPTVYGHPNFNQPGKTVYQAVVGKGAAFEGKEGVGIRTFTDGLSNTIMVVEVAPGKAVLWTKPEDWEFSPEKQIDPSDFGGLSAGNTFNAAFADGSVRVMARSIDPKSLKDLITRNGGEIVK